MKLALRLWLCSFMATAFPLGAQTYPGTPVLTTVGPLSCGMRMYAPGQVQTYCLYNNPPAPVSTVCNGLDGFANLAIVPFKSCIMVDSNANLLYEVMWALYIPVGAAGAAPVVQYQIAFEQLLCPPPTTNNPAAWITVCNYQMLTTTPPATLQSGTIQ